MGALRNRHSDAHGIGIAGTRPAPRHNLRPLIPFVIVALPPNLVGFPGEWCSATGARTDK
ncbi:MAG: hypothetical protein ACP5I8_16990 [Phycisphaerae bacterium]